MTAPWRVLTEAEIEAYESDERSIAYRAHQKRAAANARPRCICGQFLKRSAVRVSWNSLVGECSRCGTVTL